MSAFSARNIKKKLGLTEAVAAAKLVSRGTFTCNGSTPVVVANTETTLTGLIVFSLNTVGGTVGAIPSVKTITAGTGFTVAGTASDTSVYNYYLFA